MTGTVPQEENKGWLNKLILVMVVALTLFGVWIYINAPKPASPREILWIYGVPGILLCSIIFGFSYTRKNFEAKLIWFYVGVIIFHFYLYTGAYKYMSFSFNQ